MAIIKRIGKNGTKYQVRLKGSDGSWVGETFDRKADAEAYETKLKHQKKSGLSVTNIGNNISIAEYFPSWDVETAGSKISAGWRKAQTGYFRKYVEPEIGTLKLRVIAPAHILRVLNKMGERGLSEQMQLHVYNLLHKMLGDAVELFRLLSRNPVIRKLRPTVPVKESRFLSLQEAKELLDEVEGSSIQTAVYLQLFAGLRIGEVQALTWSNIFFEQKKLLVGGTYVRKEKRFKDSPKGGKQHFVDMPIELLEYLKVVRRNSNSMYVASSNSEDFLKYQTYYNHLKSICSKAGIPWVATHGLRHSTSEIYLEHGATEDDIQRLFQHGSKKTTERYLHSNGSRLAEKVQNIRLLSEIPDGSFPKVSQIVH